MMENGYEDVAHIPQETFQYKRNKRYKVIERTANFN